MQRILLTGAILCASAATIRAQDMIVGRDSSRTEARVTEIGPDAVRYKRTSNPDGPTYVLPVERIAYIRYANGERDVFAADEVIAVPMAAAAPVSGPRPEPAGQSAAATGTEPPLPAGAVFKTYRPGDYYEQDGIRGLVFSVTDDGRHGLLLSLEESEHYTAWCTLRDPAPEVGAASNTDGEKNMESVARFVASGSASWADFPAFEWCRNLGEGWYLPAVDELLRLAHAFNGGQRMVYDRKARQRFNDTLREHGGKRLDRMVDYFSSTELDAALARSAPMAVEPPYVNDLPKHQKFLVRAVRKF